MCEKHGIEIPKNSKTVKVDVPFFVFEVTPQEDGKLKIIAIGNFDAKLAFAPAGVVNYILRKFSHMMFEKLLSLGSEKKFKGSIWEKNMEKNKEFYDWIEEKHGNYFKK